MHNNHLLGCGVGIALALAVVVLTGAAPAGVGLLAVALVCPIAMVVAMKLLLGGTSHPQHHPTQPAIPREGDEPFHR